MSTRRNKILSFHDKHEETITVGDGEVDCSNVGTFIPLSSDITVFDVEEVVEARTTDGKRYSVSKLRKCGADERHYHFDAEEIKDE